MTHEVRAGRESAALFRPPRTGLIALAVPDLEDPYFAELTALLDRHADERGLAILVRQTDGEHSREVAIANGDGLPATDGLVHIPRSLTVADLTRRRRRGPLVLLGEHVLDSPFTHVHIDHRASAVAVTEHLADRGCRRVAMVGARPAAPSDAARRLVVGYRDAVAARGLAADDALVATVTAFTGVEGHRAIRQLLATGARPDGVVAATDSVALGVLAGLAEAGLRVPHDVRVAGNGDVRVASFTTPALTTIAPDKDLVVTTALDELERQIAAPPSADAPVRQVTVPFRLVERASTGA